MKTPTLFLPLLLTSWAAAQVPVAHSPVSAPLYEGSAGTHFPLGRHDLRMQTIHDLGNTTPITLTGHGYRRDAIATTGPVAAFEAVIEVWACVSANPPDQPDGIFANNVGSQPVQVLGPTRVAFQAVDRPGTSPAPTFEYLIPWSRTFALPSNAPLLLEVVIHGNTAPNGSFDRNFNVYLDANEEFSSGRVEAPGYRFGQGCSAPGRTAAHTARFDLRRDSSSALELRVDSRDSLTGPNVSLVLLAGLSQSPYPWPLAPQCQLWPELDSQVVLGSPDANGDWAGIIDQLAMVASGTPFTLQLVAGVPGGPFDTITFSDPSLVTVPLPALPHRTAVRIVSGSDRTATSGTIALGAPVTMFF